MSQPHTKPKVVVQKMQPPRKVVEIGLYLTAGQLRRLEILMGKWDVKMAVLPEATPPYKNLTEWFLECTEEDKPAVARPQAVKA